MQVDSADEVDQLSEHIRAAGARVRKEHVDAEFFTGRSAYLCDPEDNCFETVWVDMPDKPVAIASRRAASLEPAIGSDRPGTVPKTTLAHIRW